MTARTDVSAIESEVVHALRELRALVSDADAADHALTTLETFAAVALRVMAKANPGKVRSEARNVELQFRLPT